MLRSKGKGWVSSLRNYASRLLGRNPLPEPPKRDDRPQGYRGYPLYRQEQAEGEGTAAREARRLEVTEFLEETPGGEVATAAEGFDRKLGAIPADEVEAFLEGNRTITVDSSNVQDVTYKPDYSALVVSFHGGSAYLYSNISAGEALSFMQAGSKGSWVWDHLRVRGSKTAHKKPYVRLR